MAGTRALRYAAFYVCLTLIAVVFVAPYVLAFFGAFKPASDLYTSSPWSPPHSFYTGNFTAILTSGAFIRYLGTTALVDGASDWRILTRLVIPMGRPIIVTATLIAFVFGWNNFLWPLIVTDSTSQQVLTVSIAALQSSFGQQWNLVLAASLVALVPLLIIFAVFQKHIVRSIQLSGVNR